GRQRRIGAIRQRQVIERTREVQVDVILLDAGANLKVEDRLYAKRIGEGQFAPISKILSAANGNLALQYADPAQPGRMIQAPLYPQIDIAAQILRRGGL